MATLKQAAEICREVEQALSPNLPCHVALTGGTLYKDGERKDIDLLFYRVRQYPHPSREDIEARIEKLGFEFLGGWNWCTKARFKGFDIDLFFPELHPEVTENAY